LSKRFLVIEYTLRSIKEDKLSQQTIWDDDDSNNLHLMSETSLAEEWLSPEDNRWDSFLYSPFLGQEDE